VPIILTRKKSLVLGLGLLGSFFVISGVVISVHNSARTPTTNASLNRATIEGETGLSLSETPGAGIGFVLNDFHRSAVRNGKIVWEIFGKKGRYDAGKNRAEIEEPRLNVNRENGETVNLTAKRADIELTGTEILKAELFDDVVVVHNRETTIKTDRAIYVKATETIDMPNYVQAENPIFTMNGKKLHGNITDQTITITGGVRSTFKPRRKRKR